MKTLYYIPTPADADVRIQLDRGDILVGHPATRPGDGYPCTGVDLPADCPNGNGARVVISKPGYDTYDVHGVLWVVFPGDPNGLPAFTQDIVNLRPSTPLLKARRVEGNFFSTADGPSLVKMITAFRLFERFVGGGDISAFCVQVRTAGITDLRVLGSCAGMFHLDPWAIPGLETQLDRFFTACGQLGLRVNFVVHADSRVIMPDRQRQIDYWNLCGRVAQQHPNVMLSAVNEVDQTINQLASINDLQPIPGVLCSRGSNGGSFLEGPQPEMDYGEAHTNGQSEEQRKIAHNTWETASAKRRPYICSEESRFTDQFPYNAELARAIGKSIAMFIAGGCFHCPAGKDAVPLPGNELDMLYQWTGGMAEVEDRFRVSGQYYHGDDLIQRERDEHYLRIYQMRLGAEYVEVRIPYI